MHIKSKFDGQCADCGKALGEGEVIDYDKARPRGKRAKCLPCAGGEGGTVTEYRLDLTKVADLPLSKVTLDAPVDAVPTLRDMIGSKDREHFVCLTVGPDGKLTGAHTISIGTLTEASAHPREVFKFACTNNAQGFILAHNHVCLDVTPSDADLNVTARILHASRLMGIQLLEHYVIGWEDRYTGILEYMQQHGTPDVPGYGAQPGEPDAPQRDKEQDAPGEGEPQGEGQPQGGGGEDSPEDAPEDSPEGEDGQGEGDSPEGEGRDGDAPSEGSDKGKGSDKGREGRPEFDDGPGETLDDPVAAFRKLLEEAMS